MELEVTLNRLERELQVIKKIHQRGEAGESKDKIESFMTELFLVIEAYTRNVKESAAYQRLSNLYMNDLFIVNMDSIISICKGFIRNLKS